MTIQEFLAAQDAFYARHGDVVVGDEAGFSWRGCGCCGSGLGGDRHTAITLRSIPGATKPPFMETAWEGEICTDCLFFHANGDLPDLPGMDEYCDELKRSRAIAEKQKKDLAP